MTWGGWPRVRLVALAIGSLLFVYLTLVLTLVGRGGVVGTDLASYLAPAVAIVHGYGVPYVNYFDVKPPGLIFFFLPWISIFGSSLPSLVALDVLLLVGDLALLYYLLRQVSPRLQADLILGLTLAVAFGLQIFSGMFLMSETIGSFFFLLATCLAVRLRAYPLAFFAVGALCAFCAQIKEVWLFSVVALAIPALLSTSRVRAVAFLVAGWATMTALIFGGVLWLGSMGGYEDVLRYKAEIFPMPSPISFIGRLARFAYQESADLFLVWPALPVVVAAAVVLRAKAAGVRAAARELALYKNGLALCVFLLWAALLVGYTWQNEEGVGHNLILIFVPFMLLLAVALAYVLEAIPKSIPRFRSSRWPTVLLVMVVIVSVAPSVAVAKGGRDSLRVLSRSDQWSTLTTLEGPAAMSKSQFIAAHLSVGGCAQTAYGWDAGNTYIYTHSNPCSRYFLSDLLSDPEVDREFRADMVARPPDVIVYDTSLMDFDPKVFEQKVFPYAAVLKACYTASDVPTVYLRQFGPAQQSQCIADQLRAGGWQD